jgi:hypothetical protein
MLLQTGYVLCDVEYDYDYTQVTIIAYSDNQAELNELIISLNANTAGKIAEYDSNKFEAENLINILNAKFDEEHKEFQKSLILEEELGKPEKWPPKTGQEHKEWEEISNLNYQIRNRNRKLINDKKENFLTNFVKRNLLPKHLEKIISITSSDWRSPFNLNRPLEYPNYEIREIV